MNALVLKETRLLGPAFIVALLLATVPVWLLPKDSEALTLYLFELGVVFLSLSTFGREFALNTFHLMLSQPLERSRAWWTKVSLLLGAIATTFLAWRCSSVACFGWELGRFVWSEKVFLAGMISAVLFASGLWSTLLLRQVAAAFWFTILVPIAIEMLIGGLGGGAARAQPSPSSSLAYMLSRDFGGHGATS